MGIEYPENFRGAVTIDEMRAEIDRQRMFNPVVMNSMRVADMRELCMEDRYVLLAYHVLSVQVAMQEQLLKYAQNSVQKSFYVP